VEEYFKKLINGFKEFYKTLPAARRTLLFVTASAIVAGIIFIFNWAGGQTYTVLYQDLGQEDSTRVMRLLRDKNIPYQVADGGKKIMIPPESVYDVRLETSSLGMPAVGVIGYEVFDSESFGTTSFVQKVNQKRALEGELMRTINHIRGVKRSRIHLAVPEKSTFIEETKSPSASVVLELKPGFIPNESQVLGISHLVASAVPGLDPERVVVVSESGKRLSKNFLDAASAEASSRIEMQLKVDKEIESKIEAILGKVVGEGAIIAKVHSELDFDQTTQQEKLVDNENKAVMSQVKDENKLVGQRPSPQGVPGARSNIPGEVAQGETPQVRQDINKSLETTNYAIPETVKVTKKQVGGFKRLSVAVMIDKKREVVVAEDGESKAVVKDWSPEDLGKFKSIVANAIGFDPKRGDELKVESMEFHKEDFDAAERELAAMQRRKLTYSLIQYAVIGLAILAFFLLVVRPFIKWLTENSVDVVEDFLPQTLEELEKLQSQSSLPGMEDSIPELEDKVDPEKVEGQMIKEKVLSLINAHPEKAAMILHEWVMLGIESGNMEKEANTANG